MLLVALSVGLLMGGGGEGQSLGRREGIGWRQERTEGRKVDGRSPLDQTHIRRGRAFRDRESFEGVKRKQGLVLRREERQL